MLETSHCLRTRSPIIELQKLDNNLIAIATQQHGIRIFNHETCENISTFTHEFLNSQTSAAAFSPNGEFVAFSHSFHIFILHLPSKIVLKTINTDEETIQKLHFDPESKYIIAATKSGRILQYRYDGSSLIGRLYSFDPIKTKSKSSTISTFAFKNNIMACAGHNGIIFTINLHSRANKLLIQNDTIRVTTLCFIDSSKILSADLRGCIYLNSLKSSKCIKKIDSCFTKIRKIILMPNPEYFLVVGDTKELAVYNTQTLKLLHKKYIEFDNTVTNIEEIDEYTLLATLEHNSLEKIDLPTTEKLTSFIKSGELDKGYLLTNKDPLLLGTKEYKVLEIAYKKLYDKALNALIKGNKDLAIKSLEIFKYVDQKKKDIDILFKSFDNYPRFKSLYIEKKYPLAYAMASKYPPLQETFQYAKMEELWNDTLQSAQRQMDHGHPENAHTLLKDFATITEKRATIKLLLNHNPEFLEFHNSLQTNNYKRIHEIVTLVPLFKELYEFKAIDQKIKKELEHIQKDIHLCDLDSAISKLSKIQHINSIKENVDEHKDELRAVKKLKDAYEVNNFLLCFEIIDTYPILNSTELGKMLQNHWLKLISSCEQYALKGNIKEIKIKLGELITLKTRRDKIGDLFRLAFHSQIKALIAKKMAKKAEALIYSYIDIFGPDKEIYAIMKNCEKSSKIKLAITHQDNERTHRDQWIESEAIVGL